jgi:protease-4
MSNQIQAQPHTMSQTQVARYALGGVALGFALPIFLCLCLTLALFAGLNSLGRNMVNAADPNALSSGLALQPTAQYVSGPRSGAAIAIVDVNGPIVTGNSDSVTGFTGSAQAVSGPIVKSIKSASKDADVKAILLRVNSPGGSVVASNEIYKALKASGKPVVALMTETAASGGFYVSMAADHVVAHPDGLTCSIGVIFQLVNIKGLSEQLGIKDVTIVSGKNKDIGNQFRDMRADEKELLQTMVTEIYEGFVTIVSDARKLSKDEVRTIADGRICTGRQAQAMKLVDSLGGEEDAITKAAGLGGIVGEPRVIQYRRQTPFSALIGESIVNQLFALLGLPATGITNTQNMILEYR